MTCLSRSVDGYCTLRISVRQLCAGGGVYNSGSWLYYFFKRRVNVGRKAGVINTGVVTAGIDSTQVECDGDIVIFSVTKAVKVSFGSIGGVSGILNFPIVASSISIALVML